MLMQTEDRHPLSQGMGPTTGVSQALMCMAGCWEGRVGFLLLGEEGWKPLQVQFIRTFPLDRDVLAAKSPPFEGGARVREEEPVCGFTAPQGAPLALRSAFGANTRTCGLAGSVPLFPCGSPSPGHGLHSKAVSPPGDPVPGLHGTHAAAEAETPPLR